jgi:hydrogenase maturation protein HypF
VQIRRQIEVSGIVQGVGFRPYIYRLAIERKLTGTIRNTSSGVTIEIQGSPESVDDFISRLPKEAPPLSRITGIFAAELPCNGDHDFRIIASHGEEAVRTLISPDVATCDDCLREMFDHADRRYRYAFTNCTNCGPRFTITRSIPYDRPCTSMAPFTMCPACQAEYDDPTNRRFHAQPNACWDCGPRLELWDGDGQVIGGNDPVRDAIEVLRSGRIVAIKGLGGFHLAADATNAAAVALLRERKRRVGKPFAVMVADLAAAKQICEVSAEEVQVLRSIQRPIILLRRRTGEGASKDTYGAIAADVAPGNNYLGMFLPYTPLHHLLLNEGKFAALVMTSGNLSEEPIAITNDEARARLAGLADCFLVHNREILLRCDDSVVRVFSAKGVKKFGGTGIVEARAPSPVRERAMATTQQLRRSRGFVPVPVFLHDEVPPILAVGGELKNTICLTKGKHAFLSQHIGDLENLESYRFFEEAIEHLEKVLEIKPDVIAHDLHPDYFSTKWAFKRTDLPLVGVQHHHAHIASCMAENHLGGKVIGFALDGAGYGTDGHIWGGEVLVADYAGFERAAHFEYVPLPGGTAAIHEPWRMAVSYLAHHFGDDFLKMKLPFLAEISRSRFDLLLRVLDRRVNSPLTSSCGRLFDAVAAIAGIRNQVSYEAQAAIELEMAIMNALSDDAYPFELLRSNGAALISTRPMFEALVEDVVSNRPVSEISRKFHNGLVKLFVDIAESLRDRTSLNRVCLSGGTFNNRYLTQKLVAELSAAGFEVFTQNEVPAGDGGLSLGQAMVAAHQNKI